MEGVFLRKKFDGRLFFLLLSGLFLIGLYVFAVVTDPGVFGEITFLIIGLLICLLVILSWLMNRGAFIRIDETSIKARYHWFGRIDCKMTDVCFAMAQMNTLSIQLKDGKSHTIYGVENSWPLASCIRRGMPFSVTQKPDAMKEALTKLKTSRKKGIVYICTVFVLVIVLLFATVFLTGEREMHEFSRRDWAVFATMGAVNLVNFVAIFYLAQKTGKQHLPIEKLNYEIRRTIVESAPLLPGHIIKVYSDDNYTGRIVIFGNPDEGSVYYVVQRLTPDYMLGITYESEMFESIAQLSEQLDALIDITDIVLH